MKDSKIESKLASILASKPAWWHRNQEPKTKGIMLRCSESQLALLQRAAEDDEMSQQKVLERIVWPILEDRYGAGERDDEEERERRRTETKAAYVAAIQELFALLAQPASEKDPDHKERVMAANNKCGETRLAMIATWEGEE